MTEGNRQVDQETGRISGQCGECAGEDDHPRHHVFAQGRWTSRHMDCCAAAGCPDGSCGQIMADSGHAHGAALVAHLTGGRGDG